MHRLLWLVAACAAFLPARPSAPDDDLGRFSTKVLVSCFDRLKPCYADQWSIAGELARRGGFESLAARYWRTGNRALRAGIEKVAYRLDTPQALEFMKRVVAARADDGEDLYFPLNYLAKRCLEVGLKALSDGGFRTRGGVQSAVTIELFGTCGYRPAIPYLVDEALGDASLNVVIAARNSLRKLYPRSPPDFPDPDAARRYYCSEAVSEGFPVRCAGR